MIRRSHYILNLVYNLLTSSTFMDRWKISILFDGWGGSQVERFSSEPNIFLRICTHTQTITIISNLCPPMPPMLFKLRPCIQKLCNVYAYTKSWLDRTNKRLFTVAGFSPERFLISIFPASEKFDSDLELDAGMHKTDAHPCPPKIHGHGYGHPM
jgi:hypothetical protein